MYKVFINERVIYFTNNKGSNIQFSSGLVLNFFSSEIAPFIVDLLFEGAKIEKVIIEVDDYESAFIQFQSDFKLIKAAGGIVENLKQEKLFIYRLDKWDLPKGKIEKGESIEDGAIREIMEECGVTDLTIRKQLKDTFHIYELNGQLILKQTYWFEIISCYEGDLTPQIEEDITKVEWLTDNQINQKVLNNTYSSIKELIKASAY